MRTKNGGGQSGTGEVSQTTGINAFVSIGTSAMIPPVDSYAALHITPATRQELAAPFHPQQSAIYHAPYALTRWCSPPDSTG